MSKILDFYEKVLEKRRNDKTIADDQSEPSFLRSNSDYVDRITFNVHSSEWCPGMWRLRKGLGPQLLTLDDEDIDYLFNKYSKKLKDEMAAKISEIALLYKDKI